MSLEFSTEQDLEAPPNLLLELLTDAEVLIAQRKFQGAVSATVREERRDEQELVQVVDAQEYARPMGGVDKSRTVPSTTRYRWALPEMRCRWSYHGEYGERVRLEGSIRILPRQIGCRVLSGFEVEVRVPLLGRSIEKRIRKEIEAGLGPYEAYMRDLVAARQEGDPS